MTTHQLWDEGEREWPVKLHLGCGGVYLSDYVNIDMHGTEAVSRPAHATSISDYYNGLSGDQNVIPERRDCVVDAFGDLRHVDQWEPIDKIVAVQCLEHIPPSEAHRAVANWYVNMRVGGVVIVSVPDTIKTLRMLSEDDNSEFAVRHLTGKRDGVQYYHRSHWTRDTLHGLFWDVGFRQTWELENFHFYPAIVLKARKNG